MRWLAVLAGSLLGFELKGARPLRDNAFKVPLARNVLVATLAEVCS